MEIFKDWLLRFNGFSAMAGMFYFLVFIRSKKNISLLVFLVLLISWFADNLNYFFIRLIYPNSFIVGNTWLIINYFLTWFLFYKVLIDRKIIFVGFLSIFCIGSLITYLFFFSFMEANTFVEVWSPFTFILFSIFLFFDILNFGNGKLAKSPLFWIGIAFFGYYSLVLIQGLFNNYLIFDLKISRESYSWIYIINILANITKNYLLFYVLVLLDKGYPDSLKSAQAS